MRKMMIIIMAITLLIGCTSKAEENAFDFEGTVEALEDQVALVAVTKGDILSSGNRVNVYVGPSGKGQLSVGEKIVVTYDGTVMESDPLQINEIKVTKEDGHEIEIIRQDSQSTDSPDQTDFVSNQWFFQASIHEITEGGYIVTVDEGEEVRKSSDLILITTEETFEVGDRVLIEYDGDIMESYPAQINMLSIEKID